MNGGSATQPDLGFDSLGNWNPRVPKTFRIASFNVENYLDAAAPRGRVKSAESKAEVRKSIRTMDPDVLALQEMGSPDTLMELRYSLGAEGCEFPHWEIQ